MSGIRLSSRDRRAVSILLLAALGALAWVKLIRPAMEHSRELSRTLDRERSLLARESAAIADAESYARAFESGAPRFVAVAPRLFLSTRTLAGAHLAHIVEDAANYSRVFVRQLTPQDPTDLGFGLSEIGAKVSGESDLRGLLTFLDRIESTEKMVSIEELTVRGLRAGEVPVPTKPEALDFEVTISGLILGSTEDLTDSSRADSAQARKTASIAISPTSRVARAAR